MTKGVCVRVCEVHPCFMLGLVSSALASETFRLWEAHHQACHPAISQLLDGKQDLLLYCPSLPPQLAELWTRTELYHQLFWFSVLLMPDDGASHPLCPSEAVLLVHFS